MKRRRSALLLAGLVASALAAGCVPRQQTTPTAPTQPGQQGQPAQPTAPGPAGPVKVAVLAPLSGNAAPIGRDLVDAAKLALFDVSGDLVLLERDTGATPEAAAAAAQEAIAAGAELIVGPLFANATRAVAEVARAQNRRVLSFSNDATVAGNGVYVLGFRPEEQVRRIVSYAASRGLQRIAALAPNDAYGTLAAAAFRSAVAERPGAPNGPVAVYPADGRDPSGVVAQLLRRGRPGQAAAPAGTDQPAPPPPAAYDAILIADGGLRLKQIAALLAFNDVDPAATKLLGTRRWQEDPAVLADPTLRGAWVAEVTPAAEETFRRHFGEVYGRAPHPLAALAYDATALAALLASSDRTFPTDLLTDPQGFAGHSGIFRLRPDGTTEHGLAVLEVQDGGGLAVIDPAPQSFTGGFVGQ